MLTCVKYRKRLGAYMDGELSKRKRTAMDRHLSICDLCRTELEGQKKMGPILDTLAVPQAPTVLAAWILAEAHRRKKKSGIIPIRWKGLYFGPWLPRAVTTVTLVFGLITGGYMGSTSYQDAGPDGPRIVWEEQMGVDGLLSNLYLSGPLSGDSIEAVTLAMFEKDEGNNVE